MGHWIEPEEFVDKYHNEEHHGIPQLHVYKMLSVFIWGLLFLGIVALALIPLKITIKNYFKPP